MRLARELHRPEGTCDVRGVMLPRVFPEGTSGEGGTQLAGRHPDRDAALPRARHMFPQDYQLA